MTSSDGTIQRCRLVLMLLVIVDRVAAAVEFDGVSHQPHHHVNMVRKNAISYRGTKVTTDNLHQYLEDHEQVLLFGRNNARFMLVNVARNHRVQRSVDDRPLADQSVQLTMPTLDHVNGTASQLRLHLHRSHRLIDDGFVYIKRFENESVLIDDFRQQADDLTPCYFRDDAAALDLCENNVRGIVRHNDRVYLIHPLPDRFGDGAHVIIDSTTTTTTATNDHSPTHNCSADTTQSRAAPPLRRQRRFISGTNRIPRILHIETAVFVDKDLYRHMSKNYATDTEAKLIRFVLAMINGVQLLYHHPSLGHEINFVLKRLEILHNDPKGLQRSSDIDVFLNSFCLWQRKFNPVSDADAVHFDHAVILTGLDLYVVGKNGKVSSQVVGLAPVAGMCTATSSCTINEGKHFESVFVVAHEIGHNLGMRHDSAENNCDPSLFIMSPTLGSGKTTWSKCSRNYLKAFLGTHQAKCMFDRGHFGTNLDHGAEGILPGERFDADQQCLLKYGRNSVRSATQQLAEVCRDLHCQRDRYTWTSHPSLEGTHCGAEMWCKAGSCVRRNASTTDETENIAATRLTIVTANSSKLTMAMSTHLMAAPAIDNIDQPIDSAAAVAVTVVDADAPQDVTTAPTAAAAVPSAPAAASAADLTVTRAALWSDWSAPSDCESGCLFGDSGRLREGSTGLRVQTRICLDTRAPRSCRGQARRYEACSSRQCYNVPRTTVHEFAQQVCERAGKYDKDIRPEPVTNADATTVDDVGTACRVYCRGRSVAAKTKSWTYPDGTACRGAGDSNAEATSLAYYCVAGNCERFTCSSRTTNFFRADSIYCPDRQSEHNVLQDRVRDLKSLSLKAHGAQSEMLQDMRRGGGADDRGGGGGGSPVPRPRYVSPAPAKYSALPAPPTAPPPPPPKVRPAPKSQPPAAADVDSPYEYPFFRANARSWRYKGDFEVARVPRYRTYSSADKPPATLSSYSAAPPSRPPTSVFSGPSAPSFEPPSAPPSSLDVALTPGLVTSSHRPAVRWTVRSGCHFGCIEQSKGIQIVETYTPERRSNIQLCEMESIACDALQTAGEYAQKLCYRYTMKVRGLSGHGTQILASAGDPDRACKVACQDEYLPHRYYLVFGEQGNFPFGTKCSTRGSPDNRYCVNGKCLEFGPDDVPMQESHLSLALYRSKRDAARVKRDFVYYSPINITEHITPELLQSIVDSLMLPRRYEEMPILGEHIDFHNPVHIDEDEDNDYDDDDWPEKRFL